MKRRLPGWPPVSLRRPRLRLRWWSTGKRERMLARGRLTSTVVRQPGESLFGASIHDVWRAGRPVQRLPPENRIGTALRGGRAPELRGANDRYESPAGNSENDAAEALRQHEMMPCRPSEDLLLSGASARAPFQPVRGQMSAPPTKCCSRSVVDNSHGLTAPDMPLVSRRQGAGAHLRGVSSARLRLGDDFGRHAGPVWSEKPSMASFRAIRPCTARVSDH